MSKPGDPVVHDMQEATVIEDKGDTTRILDDNGEKDVPSSEVSPDWSKR